MRDTEQQFSERESLRLITEMINRAKESFHDTGVGAMMWGAVVAICSLVRLSEIHFGYRLPFDIYLLTLAAIIPQIFITIREKKERKARSHEDAFMDYLWLGFGICIFLMIFIINAIYHELGPLAAGYPRASGGNGTGFRFHEFIMPLFLVLYGMPTFVTGAACKFRPMLWGGLFCWACCVVAIFSEIRVDLLLTACAAILSWFIPGLIMEKEYRSYKKEQSDLDVQRS